MNRRRKFELSMQCWFCLHAHATLHPELRPGMSTAEIQGVFDRIIRDYRLRAGWRGWGFKA